MTRGRPSALGLAVLSLLAERPMHAYEIAATLRRRDKAASIKLTYGSLYSVMRALHAAGVIAPRRVERSGARPERTVYVLTPAGDVQLRDHLRALLRTPAKEYSAFGAAVALMTTLPSTEVAALLAERALRLDEAAIRLREALEKARLQGVPRLATIERELELAMVEAERAWASGLARLVGKSAAFTRHWPSDPAPAHPGELRARPGPVPATPSRSRR